MKVMHNSMKTKQHGLTLIEVMVTMAVGFILMSVAAPQLGNMMKSNRMTTSVNDLVFALNSTRSEAMKNSSASICVSTDQINCTPGSWHQGWIVFNDINGDCAVNGAEFISKVTEPLDALIKIGNAEGLTCINYGRSGFLAPAGSTATFNFCDDRTGAQAGRTVAVITSGRPTTSAYAACPSV